MVLVTISAAFVPECMKSFVRRRKDWAISNRPTVFLFDFSHSRWKRVSQEVMGPCPVDYPVEGMGRVEEIGMEEVLVQQIGKLACVDVFRLLVIQQGDVYGEACDFQGFFVDVDAEQVVLGYIPDAFAECLFIVVAVQFYFFFDHPSQGLD